jgi:hypothetical protein
MASQRNQHILDDFVVGGIFHRTLYGIEAELSVAGLVKKGVSHAVRSSIFRLRIVA